MKVTLSDRANHRKYALNQLSIAHSCKHQPFLLPLRQVTNLSTADATYRTRNRQTHGMFAGTDMFDGTDLKQ